MTLDEAILDELRAIRELLERQAPATSEPLPLTTWKAIAAAVGVSDDTLAKYRKARNDQTEPYFADAAQARKWYATLRAPSPSPRSRTKAGRPKGTTLADVERARAKATGRGS